MWPLEMTRATTSAVLPARRALCAGCLFVPLDRPSSSVMRLGLLAGLEVVGLRFAFLSPLMGERLVEGCDLGGSVGCGLKGMTAGGQRRADNQHD